MKRKLLLIASVFAVLSAVAPLAWSAKAAPQAIQLPAPQTTGGMPLMQALKSRRTSREFAAKPLPDQVLSNLLWAADGITRPDGRRTAPSARNAQEIDVYVARADGVYVYDAKANQLTPALAEDVRAATGMQPFVKDAPVNLIYVADYAKMSGSDEDKNRYSAADAAFIAENVYLFCTSEGLAVVVRGLINRTELAKTMNLKPNQQIILTQTVGYPAK